MFCLKERVDCSRPNDSVNGIVQYAHFVQVLGLWECCIALVWMLMRRATPASRNMTYDDVRFVESHFEFVGRVLLLVIPKSSRLKTYVTASMVSGGWMKVNNVWRIVSWIWVTSVCSFLTPTLVRTSYVQCVVPIGVCVDRTWQLEVYWVVQIWSVLRVPNGARAFASLVLDIVYFKTIPVASEHLYIWFNCVWCDSHVTLSRASIFENHVKFKVKQVHLLFAHCQEPRVSKQTRSVRKVRAQFVILYQSFHDYVGKLYGRADTESTVMMFFTEFMELDFRERNIFHNVSGL